MELLLCVLVSFFFFFWKRNRGNCYSCNGDLLVMQIGFIFHFYNCCWLSRKPFQPSGRFTDNCLKSFYLPTGSSEYAQNYLAMADVPFISWINVFCFCFFFSFPRFSGVPPSNLGNNTKLVDWMPQNDLLGECTERVESIAGTPQVLSFGRQCKWSIQWICLAHYKGHLKTSDK